ncbi:hypothetical protein [Nocardia rhizosphaerae]|uniref:Uncharacterized protein n=1 Tax=Nocardia rhizosphaerae TaxID=1691571 RepID=A0ABV8L3Q7_9NOCA
MTEGTSRMRKRIRHFFALTVIGLALAGCSGITVHHEPPVSSDSPELIQEAIEFGDWSLPTDGKVLLVRREHLDDVKYNMVVETSPNGLTHMLEQSKYTAQFRKWYSIQPEYEQVIAGPPLETSPNVQKAQDLFVSTEGDSMIRDVLVDERTPELRIVHIEFRGQ